MENCHMFDDHWFLKIITWLNPNHPSMVAYYLKCNCKLGFHVILKVIHGNG